MRPWAPYLPCGFISLASTKRAKYTLGSKLAPPPGVGGSQIVRGFMKRKLKKSPYTES